jgi:hypothetical protein
MVEKFIDKDAKNGNFNNQMKLRKKSNVAQVLLGSYYLQDSAIIGA